MAFEKFRVPAVLALEEAHWGQHYPKSRNAADDLHLAAAARARRLGGLVFPHRQTRKTNPRPTMSHGRGFWISLPGINRPNANRLILRPGSPHRVWGARWGLVRYITVPSNLVMRRPVSSSGSIQSARARICSTLSVSEHRCRAPRVQDCRLSLPSHLAAARRPMLCAGRSAASRGPAVRQCPLKDRAPTAKIRMQRKVGWWPRLELKGACHVKRLPRPNDASARAPLSMPYLSPDTGALSFCPY